MTSSFVSSGRDHLPRPAPCDRIWPSVKLLSLRLRHRVVAVAITAALLIVVGIHWIEATGFVRPARSRSTLLIWQTRNCLDNQIMDPEDNSCRFVRWLRMRGTWLRVRRLPKLLRSKRDKFVGALRTPRVAFLELRIATSQVQAVKVKLL